MQTEIHIEKCNSQKNCATEKMRRRLRNAQAMEDDDCRDECWHLSIVPENKIDEGDSHHEVRQIMCVLREKLNWKNLRVEKELPLVCLHGGDRSLDDDVGDGDQLKGIGRHKSVQEAPIDNVESNIASIDPYDATLFDEFPCPDDDFDAPEDQIRCVPSLDDEAVETFDPYPAEIPLNVQIMSRVLEDQQVLRFNCLGDFFSQITLFGPSVPVATLLCREV
jgi:hypothetical protein